MKMYLNKKKLNIKEIFISIICFFRQIGQFLSNERSATLGGNLDPFFLIAPLEIFDIIKKKKIPKNFIAIFMPIILYMILQILILDEIIVSKTIINVLKICICILSMIYVKNNINKIDIYKIAKITSLFMMFFTVIACILKNSHILWRFNDIINKYTTTRLQLFYLEPSELGFHCAIIIIILLSYLFILKSKKEKRINLACIFINLIVIYLASPFGAIVILFASVCIMLLANLIKRFTREKLILYICLMIICTVIFIFMFINESPIIMRAIDTINGTDSSNSYRVELSLEILTKSLKDYNYIGCGFGNLNSHNFRLHYGYLGMAEVLANSFIYYIIEGGIFSIITLIILIAYLMRNAFKEYSMIKIGLFVFLIMYQIFGGHFTSCLIWALYGVIVSNFNENNILIEKEEVK